MCCVIDAFDPFSGDQRHPKCTDAKVSQDTPARRSIP
jgi:hypothetical protein